MPDDSRLLTPLLGHVSAEPGKFVTDPAVWSGDEMAACNGWIYTLSDDDIAALGDIAKQVRATIGDDADGLLKLNSSEINLGAFRAPMAEVFHQIENGRGF